MQKPFLHFVLSKLDEKEQNLKEVRDGLLFVLQSLFPLMLFGWRCV